MLTKNEKISITLKKRYAEQGHPSKGKPGWKPTEEQKALKKIKSLEVYERIGRLTDKQKKARNVANVLRYRARLINAIPSDSNLRLIKEIYENCPENYHVDHIIALANGGTHHQDNLQYLQSNENCRKGARENYDQSLAIDWRTVIRR
jgi:hypothetical protein